LGVGGVNIAQLSPACHGGVVPLLKLLGTNAGDVEVGPGASTQSAKHSTHGRQREALHVWIFRPNDSLQALVLSPLETLNGHVAASRNGLWCMPGDPDRGEMLFFCGVSPRAGDVGQTLGSRWPSVASPAVSNSPNALELQKQSLALSPIFSPIGKHQSIYIFPSE
jgi:hypothetical protein